MAVTPLPDNCHVGQTRGLYATSKSREGIERAAELIRHSILESGAIGENDFENIINALDEPVHLAKTPEGDLIAYASNEEALERQLDSLYSPIPDEVIQERSKSLMGETEKVDPYAHIPETPREALQRSIENKTTYCLEIKIQGPVNHTAAYRYVHRISTPQKNYY